MLDTVRPRGHGASEGSGIKQRVTVQCCQAAPGVFGESLTYSMDLGWAGPAILDKTPMTPRLKVGKQAWTQP